MTKSELFKTAHTIARKTVKAVGNYMVAFKLALINLYKGISMDKNKCVETLLLKEGFETWEKNGMRRIYIDNWNLDGFKIQVKKVIKQGCKPADVINLSRRINFFLG